MSTTPHLALAATPDPSASNYRDDSTPDPALPLPNWEPTRQTLFVLVNLLSHSTSSQSSVQTHLFSQLQIHAQARDFNSYLVYILTQPVAVAQVLQLDPQTQQVLSVRQAAGLLLKTNIAMVYRNLHPHVRAYVYATLVDAISDDCLPVRQVVASCVSALVTDNRPYISLSALVATLAKLMESTRIPSLDGALTVVSRLAEDAPHTLSEDSSRPLHVLLPSVIHLCAHPQQLLKVNSLHILNHLILVMPPSLQPHIDRICKTLFRVAEDISPQVRKSVCTAICLLFSIAPHALMPYLRNVIEYMLQSSAHADEEVGKEATEFWALFAENKASVDALRPVLPRLVPVLLRNMVYSAPEMAALDAAASPDDMVPDRPEDVPFRFHQSRFRETSSNENGPHPDARKDYKFEQVNSPMVTSISQTNGHLDGESNGLDIGRSAEQQVNGFNAGSGSDDEDGSDYGDGGFEKEGEDSEWNLRRSSAAALDALSCVFKDDLLEVVLPHLQEKLTNSDCWEQRECGVLALGAIAEGCRSGMDVHMPSIFPFLVHSASDPHYMVRCISCWALSRYSKWVLEMRDDTYVQRLLSVLLDRMLDRNKVVQKASCSALASFQEDGGALLSSYLTPILRTITVAFDRYQQSNLVVLFDVVCSLADAVGSELANPEHLNALMPLLISKWNVLTDTNTAMLPLLECLGLVFRAIGARSQQFAANIFSRCANIMDLVYSKESKGEQEAMNVEFLISSLDLMCGLAETLGASVDPYVAKSGNGSKPLLPLLFVAMKDLRQEVRQSAFALLGEFARARMPSLIPALPEYVKYSVEAIDPDFMSVSNNATWALGELIMMAGFLPRIVPVDRDTIQRLLLERAADPLIHIVNTPQLNKTLLENSAITLGRLGLVMSESMSSKLGSFAEAVFALLRNIRDDVEKEQAFHGMNSMVRLNPAAILDRFDYYVDAIASWYHCKPDLEMEFAGILGSYKNSLGDRWHALVGSLPAHLQKLIAERFRL
eukprot:GFKZ01001500.1.p1 GENE.GFKZ01001500.1~~GFKZ01001500.1.p1  ORF type:complete len:1086 (+),score=154.60 GFKZ01001500.1:258-3260(+)